MPAPTKCTGSYFWDYDRVWTEANQTGVSPFMVGSMDKRISLLSQPNRATIRALCEGTSFLNHVPKNRVNCFDVTYTFSKGVSLLLYGLTPPAQWKQSTELLVDVTKPQVAKLVDNQLANSGAQGRVKVPSQGVAYGFPHWQSYQGTPHAHIHYPLPNVTISPDGKLSSIANARPLLFLDQGVRRAQANKALDDKLQDLGFQTVRVGKAVELAGIPKALIDELSPARAAMNKMQQQKGFSGPAAMDAYARQARQGSGGRVQKTPDEMHRDCTAIAARHGVTIDKLKRDPKLPPPSKDDVGSMSTAYDVALKAVRATAKKYGDFTADQYKERLFTLGIGQPTTSRALEVMGNAVLSNPKFAKVTPQKMPDGSIRYSTKQSQAVQAKVEKQFVREAWEELKAAGKTLGETVLVATAKKMADVISGISEAAKPAPKTIIVHARSLERFNRAHRPTNYALAHAKAFIAGVFAPGNPHEKAGAAERAYAEYRRCQHLPRKAIVVVDRSILANARELDRLVKIAKRDGASVVLTHLPPRDQRNPKTHTKSHSHHRSHHQMP